MQEANSNIADEFLELCELSKWDALGVRCSEWSETLSKNSLQDECAALLSLSLSLSRGVYYRIIYYIALCESL